MQLFFCHTTSAQTAVLNDEETRHLKVLRKNIGDTIQCIDGKGYLYECEVQKIGKDASDLSIVKSSLQASERSYYLHLLIAPTKNNERIEWMLEKSIEVGIDEISFIDTEHSEKHRVNYGRLERIAISALKQSGRYYMPKINELAKIKDIQLEAGFFFAHCEVGEKTTFKDVFTNRKPQGKIEVLVGPEGDFSSTEIHQFKQLGGIALSLGEGRLRTETAGLYVATALSVLA